ncbi:hypothetical protein PAUR_b0275 [Pseudoalteromonas aurantia 208]|uniref:Uncharacterized protein n=1 Tax=Pseudoalteromonas aurantia 208 TaxID=1314867 RepID=A0ABR9EIM3_9GAMM|nr:hypothetical protein [Pseudoalteromonas aurantia 208]
MVGAYTLVVIDMCSVVPTFNKVIRKIGIMYTRNTTHHH